jgi:hypothetical protein
MLSCLKVDLNENYARMVDNVVFSSTPYDYGLHSLDGLYRRNLICQLVIGEHGNLLEIGAGQSGWAHSKHSPLKVSNIM